MSFKEAPLLLACALPAFALWLAGRGLGRAWALVALVPMAMAALSLAGVRVNLTPSVPEGLYLTHAPEGPVVVGDYVCLDAMGEEAPEALRAGLVAGELPSLWKHQPLLKKVAAVAGDEVSLTAERSIAIHGQVLPDTHVRTHDSAGHALVQAELPRRLGPGEVWLTSEHGLGFDSRYFGAVRVGALSCVGAPLWTW